MDPDKSRIEKPSRFNTFVKHINAQNLLKNVWQVASASILIAILNIVFQVVLSRKLGPEQYGELQTLLTINAIIMVVVAAVAVIVTRFISIYKAREQYDKMRFLANWAFVFFFCMGLILFIIIAFISKSVAYYLHIADAQIIIVFGLLIWVSFMVPVIEGILRGVQDFTDMGRYKLVETASRVILAIIVVYIGLRTKSILLALAVGSLIAILLYVRLLRSRYIARATRIDMIEIYKFTLPVIVACLILGILSNIDLVLVKHLFSAQTAGFFAAAGGLAKIGFGIALGVASVMFPKVVEDYANGDSRSALNIFRHSMEIVLTSGILLVVGIGILAKPITALVFGPQYQVIPGLWMYCAAFFFLSITTVYMMYNLAVKKYWFIVFIGIAALVQIVGITQYSVDISDVIGILFWSNLVLMGVMAAYNFEETFSHL